ncbi:hypothetical protein WAI453_002660 [Rhynchosporium graminicola]
MRIFTQLNSSPIMHEVDSISANPKHRILHYPDMQPNKTAIAIPSVDSSPSPPLPQNHRTRSQDVELITDDESPIPSPEPDTTRSNFRITAIMIALYLAMFITALDQTIVATAIPTIAHDLESASGYVWIGGAYLLASAAAGPIWAKLSDIFGKKSIILLVDVLFFLLSIVCAEAKSVTNLIMSRTFQGIAGGGLIPMVIITISDLFSVTLYIGLVEVVWIVAGGV